MRRPATFATGALMLLAACGGGGGGSASPATTAATTPATTAASTSTSTTKPSIEGVETFAVEAGHTLGTVTYPQVPPVGGVHNPVTMPCTFYDQAVPNERAVHSLEHGAVWITYRPDAAAADLDVLAALARSRKDILVSPWPQGLPAPFVASAWGVQLQLQSVSDPRLAQFVAAYASHGPENVPC